MCSTHCREENVCIIALYNTPNYYNGCYLNKNVEK
jgi:hypothetical protein